MTSVFASPVQRSSSDPTRDPFAPSNNETPTDVREVARELHLVDDLAADLGIALHPKREHPPERVRAQEPEGVQVRFVRLKPEVRHPRHLRVLLEPPAVLRSN